MEKVVYQVFVPPILEELTDFGFKSFSGEKIEDARNAALEYLSEVVVKCVKEGRILIKDLDSAPIDIFQEQFWLTPKQLNFPKLLEMKIEYVFGDKLKRLFLYANRPRRIDPENFGFLSMDLLVGERPYNIFNFTNEEKPRQEEDYVFRRNFKDLKFPPLYPEVDYQKWADTLEMTQIFNDENQFAKIVVKDHNFRDFEKEFLSIMNCECTDFHIFHRNNGKNTVGRIIKKIEKTYSFDYNEKQSKLIQIGEEKYTVHEYSKKTRRLYYRGSELYLRNRNGAYLCNETTTFEDVLKTHHNPEMQDLLDIL